MSETFHAGPNLGRLSNVTVVYGDCLDAMAELAADSVDAIVTDPPYGLGFMGKHWDSLPPGLDWAKQCLRVLKPGGHLLAFGGARTWHRLACAVEDAGFEIRDSIAWLYGSGFPKSLDVSKAIDKAAGATREVVGKKTGRAASPIRDIRGGGYIDGRPNDFDASDITAPATPEAAQWQGWGTALKPAWEGMVTARKPLNLVPLGSEVDRLHHLLGSLIWLSLSPAKRAELSSLSSRAEPHEAMCASALADAAINSSPGKSGGTVTFNSLEAGSTSLSIATSWSSILGALSDSTTTSTTSTESSMTTGLRILSSLLAPLTSQTTMPQCGCLSAGSKSSAPSAVSASGDEWANWLRILSASVPETAICGIAQPVAVTLASIADGLSSDAARASSARTGATDSAGGSLEPIVVARKPLIGTVAGNVLRHGTGALNIDGCRIGAGSPVPGGGGSAAKGSMTSRAVQAAMGYRPAGDPYPAESGSPVSPHTAGRWPANVVLDESQAAALDEQSGTSVSRIGTPRGAASGDGWGMTATGAEYDDSGGASRFFYCAKAPKRERPTYDTYGCICDHSREQHGAGTLCLVANCWCVGFAVDRSTIKTNSHATVKPLTLMRWLVRLVTPPGGVCLDPFAGSGTTVEAALLEGFRVIGIEREADYLPMIQQRIVRCLNS